MTGLRSHGVTKTGLQPSGPYTLQYTVLLNCQLLGPAHTRMYLTSLSLSVFTYKMEQILHASWGAGRIKGEFRSTQPVQVHSKY